MIGEWGDRPRCLVMTESGENLSGFSGTNPSLSWAARSAGVPVDLAKNEVVTARPNPGPRLSAHSRRDWNQSTGIRNRRAIQDHSMGRVSLPAALPGFV
jgi:hypothetical protein